MWVSTKEAAKLLNVSERTVRRWVRNGKLKKKIIHGKGGARSNNYLVWIEDILITEIGDTRVRNKSITVKDLQNIEDNIGDTNDTPRIPKNGVGSGVLGKCPQIKGSVRTIGDIADTKDIESNALKDNNLSENPENSSADRGVYWLEVEEVARLLGISERTVRRKCARGDVRSKKEGGRYLVRLDSLPIEAQYRYLESRLGLRYEDRVLLRAKEKGIQFEEWEARTRRGQERIRALIMFLSKPEGVGRDEWAEVVGRMVGRSRQTIWRWYAEYVKGKRAERKEEVYVLPSGRVIRLRSLSREIVEFAVRRLVERSRSAGLYHGIRGHVWGDVKRAFLLDDSKKPTFYRVLGDILSDAGMVAYLNGGRRALEREIAPYIRRDRSLLEPLEIIVGDQKVWDWVVEVDGKVVRPVSYFFLDMKTMAVVGHVMSISTYSRWEVGLALRRAVSLGIPDVVYFDNGKAELSKYMEQIRNRVGFIQWTALPYNARAKINETFHQKMDLMLREEEVRGYFRRSQDRDRNLKMGEELKGGVLSFEEFYRTVERMIDRWNGERIGEVLNSSRPGYGGEDLEWLFLYGVVRKVRHSTVQVSLDGFGKMVFYSPRLGAYEGQRVEVRIDPYMVADSRTVYVLDLEGRFIDRAELWEAIDPRDREALAEKLQRRRRILSLWREFFNKYERKPRVIKIVPEGGVERRKKGKGIGQEEKLRAYLKLAEIYEGGAS